MLAFLLLAFLLVGFVTVAVAAAVTVAVAAAAQSLPSSIARGGRYAGFFSLLLLPRSPLPPAAAAETLAFPVVVVVFVKPSK